MIPNPEDQPLMTVEAAGAALGLGGRSASYGAAGRGELPTIRIGRRLFVPTAELRRLVGLDPTRDNAEPSQPGAVIDLPASDERTRHGNRSPSPAA